MDKIPALGFVGFGEAAFHIAKGLRSAGIREICAYDIHRATPGRCELIQSRAALAETQLVSSNADLAANSEIIFSTVTADQALAAAQQTSGSLKPAQLYADLNSVSPGLKQKIGRTISATGGRFVEVAVMAPVPPYGHKVPLLIGGEAGSEFAERLASFGMKIEIGSDPIGSAAATKMCRSIMVKGIEALMTECVLASTHYGVDEAVLSSLEKTFPGTDWRKQASYLVGRVAVHGERRAREMEEVSKTLIEAGVEPMMVDAIVRRMDWSVHLGLRGLFGDDGPKDYREFANGVASLEKVPAAK